jgi:TonB-dependent SusC/RagA subfamily outer membrane receptor
MKRIVLNFFILIISLAISGFASGQDRIIHGIVTTFDSIPLIDAEVKVASTKEVVHTDTLGRFTINTGLSDKLRVSANGFFNQKVKLNEKVKYAAVNLKMKPGEKNREYAIGYGHVSNVEKLSAVANLNKNDMDFSQYSDIFELIEGRFAGVQVINNEVIIRGVNSFNLSSAALIVVDGVMVDGSVLSTIPPTQVESINVIKDGTAAIYGSRGANGVVLIETRRGDD